jgi:hypothetical protein
MLIDKGSEYNGHVEHHAFEPFLGIEGVRHTTTKAYYPQTHGVCELFHKHENRVF